GTFERGLIRRELNQISGYETRREPEVAQHVDEQPRRIATRSFPVLERPFGREHARLVADDVADGVFDAPIDVDEEADRVLRAAIAALDESREEGSRRAPLEVQAEIGSELGGVLERILLRPWLEEEVERIVGFELYDEIDLDRERRYRVRQYDPRDEV